MNLYSPEVKSNIGDQRILNRMARRIKQHRAGYSIPFVVLAKKAKVTKSNLSRIERGISNPTILTMMRIAKALETTVQELIS